MKKLRLRKGQERRLLEGCLWVFSNQIDEPLHDYQPGEIVRVTTRSGQVLGVGYVNPHSLIAIRLLSSEQIEIDLNFFLHRFKQAHKFRNKILPGEDAVREIFSESDGLPGLILDRYGDIIVMQINTAGMEVQRELLIEVLRQVYHPQCIYERSDSNFRKLEGLEPRVGTADGEIPDQDVWLKFAGLTLPVNVVQGQKTGLYLDQRNNIEFISSIATGARVLDAFSYVGPWGLKAAKSGASEVTFLDSSEWTLKQAKKAARRARVGGICRTLKTDVFDAFKIFASEKRTFDLVVVDPPSFIKSRSRYEEGYKGYFDLNQRALALVEPGGFLITSSCSHHLDETTFLDLLRNVLRRSQRSGRIVFKGQQGPDHPILPAMPETEYLHCIVLQID